MINLINVNDIAKMMMINIRITDSMVKFSFWEKH